MSRRAYPILGRSNLKLSDGNISASKPVYLRYKILGGRSEDQLGPVWERDLTLDLDLDLDPGLGTWIPVSQILD